MDTRAPPTPIHFYDTEAHRILCGLRGFESRSSKHARTVTCSTCIDLLGERTAAGHAASTHAAAGAPH